ncbi:MAG: hypothetical protein IJ444_02015 [Kiritimatiellae bacterium]|nr:hypothetical protein [Kiritimatiellia bacterium]
MGNFVPTYSTDNIWRDENMDQCLSDDLDTIEANIAALQTGKANTTHAHSEYALANHEHSEYALENHEHDGYASQDHEHLEYADAMHGHDEYALANDLTALQALVGDTAVAAQIAAAMANIDMTGYATETYVNTQVSGLVDAAPETLNTLNELAAALGDDPNFATTIAAQIGGKADVNHTHAEYAAANHEHSGYAVSTHEHTGYANATHTHTGYAAASDVAALQTLVGDTAVSTQISNAVANKADANHSHGDLYYTESEVDSKLANKVDKVAGKGLSTYDYTEADKKKLTAINANANESNFFSSLTDIGITTFPTTMKLVSEAMPKNSMIVIDTRRVNGAATDYGTETISDWGNDANGVAIIVKGVSTARIGMFILYGTTATTSANIHYGSYAHDADNVNWINVDDKFKGKVDKVKKYSAVDLNTLTESGLYYVSDETTALHCPAGSNGHILVMSDGTRVRQVFFRVGTVDTNSWQWYSRHLGSDLTAGLDSNGWSQWWLLSGTEKVWNGGTVLNSEINIGSRYGCQSWIVVARLQNTGAMASVVIPRHFLTNDTDLYKFQIADETAYISFFIYYKSDNDVYLKVVDQTDSEYTTLKYVYRMS